MKKFVLTVALAACLIVPAAARNLVAPAKNPAIAVSLPDKWKVEEIEFGYSAKSPDGDVFFSIESANAKKLDAMMDNNNKWMKENKIDASKAPEKVTLTFNGVEGEVLRFNTKDENGPTIVDFVMLPGGKGSMVMVTLWASDAERKTNAKDIDAIMNSIKPLN